MRSTLETPAEVRVAVVPVSARTRPAEFGRFFGLVAQHAAVDLGEVASFYQERQKSPLQHLRFQGHLRFRFTTDLRGGGALEELMMHRKTFGSSGSATAPTSATSGPPTTPSSRRPGPPPTRGSCGASSSTPARGSWPRTPAPGST